MRYYVEYGSSCKNIATENFDNLNKAILFADEKRTQCFEFSFVYDNKPHGEVTLIYQNSPMHYHEFTGEYFVQEHMSLTTTKSRHVSFSGIEFHFDA